MYCLYSRSSSGICFHVNIIQLGQGQQAHTYNGQKQRSNVVVALAFLEELAQGVLQGLAEQLGKHSDVGDIAENEFDVVQRHSRTHVGRRRACRRGARRIGCRNGERGGLAWGVSSAETSANVYSQGSPSARGMWTSRTRARSDA